MEIVSSSVLDMEKDNDSEIVNSIYRVFHTIKGNAYLTGFTTIGKLAHRLEDVLSAIKVGGIEVTSELVDHFLEAIDSIKAMTEDISCGGQGEADTDSYLQFYDKLLQESEESAPLGEAVESNTPAVENIDSETETDEVYNYSENSSCSNDDDIFGAIPKNSFRRLRILVVEDDFTSRQLLIAALSRYGDCHVAKDGLEAVQAVIESYESIESNPYDLICMDVQMPNMDGTVAAKTIREIERGKDVEGTEFESVIIMISCVEDPKVIMKACYQCGANHYFVKPLDLHQMTRQMQKLGLISATGDCAAAK